MESLHFYGAIVPTDDKPKRGGIRLRASKTETKSRMGYDNPNELHHDATSNLRDTREFETRTSFIGYQHIQSERIAKLHFMNPSS